TDASIHPGVTETPYNGKDDDCNPATKDEDLDGDGVNHDTDCNDNDANIHPGAAEIPYDGVDQDCSGADMTDAHGDGVHAKLAYTTLFHYNDASIPPTLTETPYNGKDNDCNPATPDDDIDGDGYRHDKDCNDNDRTVHPGAREIAYDGIDQD